MIAYTLGRPLLRPCMALDLIVIRTRVLRIKVPSSFCTQIEDIFQTVLVWKPLNLKESLTSSKNLPHILQSIFPSDEHPSNEHGSSVHKTRHGTDNLHCLCLNQCDLKIMFLALFSNSSVDELSSLKSDAVTRPFFKPVSVV